jgi:hypothetical protein
MIEATIDPATHKACDEESLEKSSRRSCAQCGMLRSKDELNLIERFWGDPFCYYLCNECMFEREAYLKRKRLLGGSSFRDS